MLRRLLRSPVVLGLLAILLVYLFAFRWRAREQVTRRHADLIEAIEEKKWGRCGKLVAPDYRDRWGFNRSDLLLTLKDVGRQFFIVLDMKWKTEKVERDGKTFRITGHGSFTGKGSPLAPAIESRSNRYRAEPFTFHWKKQGSSEYRILKENRP